MRMQAMRVQRGRRRAGSTLVVVALLIATVAMLSMSFLMVLQSSQKENQGSRQNLAALYACEAGLAQAVKQLSLGQAGNVGSSYQPAVVGDQSYWVAATDIGGGRIALESHGQDGAGRMGVELVVQAAKEGFFRWAAFADEDLHMDSNSRTDSYDSTLGLYSATNGSGSDAWASANGHIGSNADIALDSNAHVFGDAVPGTAGTVTTLSNSEIEGSTTPLSSPVELPAIVLPTIPPSGTSYTGTPVTLPPGEYNFTRLRLSSNKVATIRGPATIVCGDFQLYSNAKLYIDATDGPVEFYVRNDFSLSSNTLVASTTRSPLDVSINLLSDNILDPGIDVDFDSDDLTFDSNAGLYGTIYAPSAAITIDSNFELYGALVARRVDLRSNCRIHYDEALAEFASDSGNDYETISWRLLPRP